MERVSDEWLARRIVAFDEMRCGDSELHVSPKYAQAMLDALLELQSRRAADTMCPEWHRADEPAEREQAAQEPDAWPLGWMLAIKHGSAIVYNSKGKWLVEVPLSPGDVLPPTEPQLEQSAISVAQKYSAGVIGQNEARKEILQLALDMAQSDMDREERNLRYAERKQRSTQDAAVLWRNEYMAAKQSVARAKERRDALVRQAIEVWGEDK